uniref:RNA2 polyprotein n=1 Tax=Cherry virus F TaxID=2171759 RepID=A0A2S0U4B0_9SECO|nr:polyprotein 2 [Cherry virus F]
MSGLRRAESSWTTISQEPVPIGPGNSIPADVLADRARAYRETVPQRQSVLPRNSDIYGSRFERFRRLGAQSLSSRVAPTRRVENVLSAELQGTHVIDVPIPFLGSDTVNADPIVVAMDERMSLTQRSASGPTNAHVGVVEVAVEGMVAQGADTVVGALLYDARHQDARNAFLGAFASTIAAVPARVVFYPNHTVSLLQADAARTLHLAMVVPNNDMRDHDVVAHVRTSTVAQLNRGVHEDVHTRHLINSTRNDRAQAVSYLDQNIHVIHSASRPRNSMPNMSIPFSRSVSMRQTGDLTWERVERPRQSVVLQFDSDNTVGVDFGEVAHAVRNPGFDSGNNDDPSIGQAIGSLEVEMSMPIVHANEMTQRVLYSSTATIATNVTIGTVVSTFTLSQLLSAATTHSPMLQTYGRVPGKLLIRSKCQIPPACGVSLLWIYSERGSQLSNPCAIKQASSNPHIFWNPACQASIDFWVSPFSCSSEWLPSFCTSLQNHFRLICATSWQQAPKTSAAVQFAVYFEPEVASIPRTIKVSNPDNLDYRRYLGLITFSQAVHTEAKCLDISLGLPFVYDNGLGYSLSSSILSQYQYWKGDVFLEIVKASSPFVTATISVALLPGGKAWTITPQTLSLIPHVSIAISNEASRYVCKIPKEIVGMYMLSNSASVNHKNGKNMSANLAIWVRDSVTSSVDGDLALGVSVARVENLEVMGHCSGFPLGASRAQFEAFGTKWNDVYKYVVPFGTKGKHSLEVPLHCPLDLVVTDKTNVGITMFHSPLSLILRNCCWSKGKIQWKLCWYAAPMKFSDRTSSVEIEVHETNAVDSLAYVRECSSQPSGTFVWETEFHGPVEGFMYMDKYFLGQPGFTKASVNIVEVSEYLGYTLMAKFDENFTVSGESRSYYTDLTSELNGKKFASVATL